MQTTSVESSSAGPALSIEKIFEPLTFEEFRANYYLQKPYSARASALAFRRVISWSLLTEIFESGYDNCRLARAGRFSAVAGGRHGQLTLEQASYGFCDGSTIVIRKSESAHPALAEVARDFQKYFDGALDLQIYATPANQEGFDWHYDIEDVFVLQSSGEKEFSLRIPTKLPRLDLVDLTSAKDSILEVEYRCLLRPGDFLYIPAGVWHKARAITPSFHLSVGVMAPERRRTQAN